MTPQEAQMLEDLVRKVEGTQLTEKDPDAEALLRDGLARDPDAIYKLAQTVLIQNLALDQARAQMQRMQQEMTPAAQPQPSRATSFLGGLLHRNPPPPIPQYQAPPPDYPPAGYAAGPGYGQPAGGGGFLRSAATTAAGVAGGMLAFEGVEHLLHGGFGGGGFGGYGGAPIEETVVNNYYEDPAQQGYGSGQDVSGPDEQPQGPYDASADLSGPDEQPQGPFDDSGDSGFDQVSDDQGYDDNGGDFGGGDGSDFV